MSMSYYFVNPLVRQQMDVLNALLQQKKEDLLAAIASFREQNPELELTCDSLEGEIDRSSIFREQDSYPYELRIGKRSMSGFRFGSWDQEYTFSSIEDVRRFHADHPSWIIEEDCPGQVISLAELEDVIRNSPRVTQG